MQPTIDEIKKNYERYSSEKLIRLATEDAAGLRPEAVEVLKQIINERGLSGDISKGIDIQFVKVSSDKLLEYCDILRQLPCPICNSEKSKLNAIIASQVISMFIFETYEKELIIGCPFCLNKKLDAASTKTVFWGWWSLPFGFFKSIQSFLSNFDMRKSIKIDEPSEVLKNFVQGRIGRIEAHKNNREELQLLIEYIR